MYKSVPGESSTTSAWPSASLSLQTEADPVIFHFQLWTRFELRFVLRSQTRRVEEEYSRGLVLPKADGRCLDPVLIQRHRQDRAPSSAPEDTRLVSEERPTPAASCLTAEGACDSLNKTEVCSTGERVTLIFNYCCRV